MSAALQLGSDTAVADLEGGGAGSPTPLATDRRRHCTPDKWQRYYGDAIANYKQVTYSDASIIISLFKHV